MNRLQEKYQTSVRTELANKFAYKSSMQIPRLEKIVINMGVGDAVANSKVLDDAVEELTLIAGQKPVVTKAKKSIANFKLREGMSSLISLYLFPFHVYVTSVVLTQMHSMVVEIIL